MKKFKNYLVSSFSVNMLSIQELALVRFRRITPEEVPQDVVSAIGHADTARIVSGILGREIPENRISVKLDGWPWEQKIYLAQYIGPRLPEGATTLPEGATIEFFVVDVRYDGCRGCQGELGGGFGCD